METSIRHIKEWLGKTWQMLVCKTSVMIIDLKYLKFLKAVWAKCPSNFLLRGFSNLEIRVQANQLHNTAKNMTKEVGIHVEEFLPLMDTL
jgi:hypothetical protein